MKLNDQAFQGLVLICLGLILYIQLQPTVTEIKTSPLCRCTKERGSLDCSIHL